MSHPAPSPPIGGVEPAGSPAAGRTFQHYEVLRREDGSPWELGRGTMGITYKAFDVNLCCEVALKVVNSALLNHPKSRERFVREARAAAALRHRNVASVYHLGNDGEHFFYAMELIEGETLDALVRRQGPMPVETALQIILQTARALAAADRQQLVHRDIKPTNIMIVHEDADDHMVVKVIDFGLVRPAAGGGTSTGQLTAGGFVGTPQFASPEQLEERRLDTRSDIYSLGVTTWFLLTGRAPFTGSLATICHQHLTVPPPLERLPEMLPVPVRRLLARMLEKDPANRPQNAVELRREIECCLEAVGSPSGLPTTTTRRADDDRHEMRSPTQRDAGSTSPQSAGFDFSGESEVLSVGSISDRLTLVTGEPSSVGRWLLGVMMLTAVFVLVVAGVWIALAQRLPRVRKNTSPDAAAATPAVQNHDGRHRATNTPRPTVPPPLPVEKVRVSLPPAAAAVLPSVASPNPPSSPVPTAQEQRVNVRIKSVPSGAEIRSGGILLGTTPCEVDLSPGMHELVARYDGWPETRETLALGENQSHAVTEIHLMPPGLVPIVETPAPAAQASRPQHVSPAPAHTPAAHSEPPASRRVEPAIPVVPSVEEASPAPTVRNEPEVRRALPPLTPFDPDGTPDPNPSNAHVPQGD